MKKFIQLLLRISAGSLIAIWAILLTLEIGARTTLFLAKQFPSYGEEEIVFYALGGSTTLGSPFSENASFVEVLRKTYQGRIGQKKIIVKNLAYRGQPLAYNYWQLLRELHLHRPKHAVVLVYSGINDYFYRESNQAWQQWKICQISIICRRISYQFEIEAMVPPSLRKYNYRLHATIDLVESFGFPVFLSTLVGNIHGYDPAVRLHRIAERWRLVEALLGKKKFKEALQIIDELIPGSQENAAFLFYQKALLLDQLGELELAEKYYAQAVDHVKNLRPTTAMNKAIRKASERKNVILVDTEQTFRQSSAKLDQSLFVDAHHPSIKGYRIMAQAFLTAVSTYFSEKLYASPDMSGITAVNRHSGYLYSNSWLLVDFSSTDYKKLRLKFLEQNFNQIDPKLVNESHFAILRSLFAVVANKLDLFLTYSAKMDAAAKADGIPNFSFQRLVQHLSKDQWYVQNLKNWYEAGKIDKRSFRTYMGVEREVEDLPQ